MSKTYREKLLDPRWQRRRLEVFQRADFKCEECDSAETTLHVHHRRYRRGADPWDYPDHELACLCAECHTEHEDARSALEDAIGAMALPQLCELAGFAIALATANDPEHHDFIDSKPLLARMYAAHEAVEGFVRASVDSGGGLSRTVRAIVSGEIIANTTIAHDAVMSPEVFLRPEGVAS